MLALAAGEGRPGLEGEAMQLAGAVLSGFGLALLAPWISRVLRRAGGFVLALLPLGLTAYFASLVDAVAGGRTPAASYPWVPSLGVPFSLRADGLSLLFALLVTGVGALVIVFASAYLRGHPGLGRLQALLLAFMASMLGLVLADDVVTLYLFWELTSIASYFLIGFHDTEAESRAAAWQALLVTSAGGLCLLAGLLLLSSAGGSLHLSTLLARGDAIRAHPSYLPALVLVLAGAATKSAQLPFHFWLPSAMAAPTPVSAYLHSATMVKAGVYLLARLHPALGGTEAFRASVTALGAATMLTGAYLAWTQTDLKKILAYSTVSALGTLVMLVGWGSEQAIGAAVVYVLAHAAYKGALFLSAGSIDHAAGTRDVTLLGGLSRRMPVSAVAAGLAALSMAGLPPLLGFLGKELLIQAVWGAPALVILAGLAGVSHVIAAGLAGYRPFFGPAPEREGGAAAAPHEAPPAMWLGPAVLAAAGLWLGVAPGPVAGGLIAPAATAALGRPARVDLSLSHALSPVHGGDINFVLLLGLAAVLIGLIAYSNWDALRRAARPLDVVLRWGPSRWYDWALSGMLAVARWQTRALQNGNLRHYLIITIVTTAALVGAALSRALRSFSWGQKLSFQIHEAALAALILAAAVVAARARSRSSAVVALGVVGYGVALLFAVFGAPDLAMTQLTVETLTVVLLALMLYRLPRFSVPASGAARARDVLVAAAAGTVMTLLVLMVTTAAPSRLTLYFAENSAPRAHGRNVVNVILVDFRALDTLGEITVLAVAAIGGRALLKLRPS